MTDSTPRADRPSPDQALEAAFRAIAQRNMRDMPMLNPALAVQAVAFRPWRDDWLGILITPWFMNLMLMPRVSAKWQPLAERETRHHVFPAGVFEFIGSIDPVLGNYQACSLFSPMFEFVDQAAAHATATAALDALFDTAHRQSPELRELHEPSKPVAPHPAGAGTLSNTVPMPSGRTLSKREFLFATQSRARGGP